MSLIDRAFKRKKTPSINTVGNLLTVDEWRGEVGLDPLGGVYGSSKINWDSKKAPAREMVDLTCDNCGKEFQRYSKSVNFFAKHGQKKFYCSKDCYFKKRSPDKPAQVSISPGKVVSRMIANREIVFDREDPVGDRILVVPDVHIKPGVPNDRMIWLGKYINKTRPNKVVCLGDFADMESLSSFDVGKRKFEGRRYQKDIDHVIEAQKLLFDQIDNSDEIEFHMLNGNHEHRIDRATNDLAQFEGAISLEDLQYENYWDLVYPFKEIQMIDGIAFNHYFPGGLMDRPIGGVNPARAILNRFHNSCIAGHSHTLSCGNDTLPDGRRIWAIVAGCYLEHYEDFVSKATQKTWWRGLLILNRVNNGDFDPNFVSLAYLKERYGS